jgi:citrate/tricarballylate utilization protein
MLAAGLYSVVVMALAGRAYWREVSEDHDGTSRPGARPVLQAIWYAATLRYLRGGGGDCYYPVDDRPSPARRRLHAMVAYGFGLCLVSTIAAGVLQDIAGVEPPYPLLSVPVISGTIGGIGLLTGCAALLVLKARASAVTSFAQMTIKDYGLLAALAFLALSGLATLLTRDTAAFGIVLLIHMAALVESFAMAPYSKFVHLVFRFAALVRDNLERDRKGAA